MASTVTPGSDARGKLSCGTAMITAECRQEDGTSGPRAWLPAAGMSSWDQRRQKNVVRCPTTTNVGHGRASRQGHLTQESQSPRHISRKHLIMEVAPGGTAGSS